MCFRFSFLSVSQFSLQMSIRVPQKGFTTKNVIKLYNVIQKNKKQKNTKKWDINKSMTVDQLSLPAWISKD